ncbi:TPR repeat-containing protein [Mucor ambiguus]|uniref:TPR repeat-containing protein n=1 Tax=Mucor ambiguus TaxID=91626 RepID=A0A0C9MRF5_9FUNG|nr:TPR repeat-containing protein [Mucor ambiguus]
MTNGFFGRLFGGSKAKSTTSRKLTPPAKKQHQQKSALTTSTSSSSSSSRSRSSSNNNKPPSPSPSLPSPQLPPLTSSPSSPSPSLPTPSTSPSPPKTPSIETKSKNDMSDFYNIQGTSNDTDAHLNEFHNLLQHKHEQQDEYFTISSATSSHLSLQDALFSHLSTSDTQSEITQFSDFPKIAVGTQPQQTSFDRRRNSSFSVADDMDSGQHVDPYDDTHTKHLYELYMDALRHLSPKSGRPSPAQAFRLFEYVANQPTEDAAQSTRHLIAYAQYYTGRMLYEATLEHDQDEFIKQQGLKYLLDASKNGIACATFMLGYYAECDGDIEYACNLYYQAALKGQLLAKVYYGNTVLFRDIKGHLPQDAVLMLKEASHQGHSIASLSLALYYEKLNQIDLALKYAAHVNLPAKHPYFCISSYQIGIIYLKAGIEYADIAFRYLLASASSHHGGSKYTPALRKLGTLSLMGIGTSKNPTTAFNLIQEAAKLGDEPANIILGQMYQKGQGCVADLFRAMQIFENYPNNMAAKLSRGLLVMKDNPHHAYHEFASIITHAPTAFDLEHWDVQSIKNEASVRIAVWEYNGIGGTEKNPERAFHTLKKLSDDCNYSGAHFWLANAYLDGVKLDDGTVIVPKNQDLAFRCFLRGAHQNQPKCQYYAGLMLKDGYSCAEYNKSHALAFFMDAANQNHDMALTQVGAYYFTGSIGTQGRDLDKAFRYFSAAAKQNNALAIQYLADYMIKNNASGPINHYQIYTELNRSAGAEQDPIAYRMLALVVVNSSIHPSETYEDKQHPVYEDLVYIYNNAKIDAMMSQSDLKFKFALHLLWRAIELNDHASGQYLCNFYSRMNDEDVTKTIELFQKVEMGVPNKLTIAFARFLKVSKNRASALTKFIEVASCNDITTSIGWTARLEAAKLILLEHQGKARTKTLVFSWLSDMIKFNGKNLFVPFILLAKCHDDEICAGCKKSASTNLYESGLLCKLDDAELELFARMRLIETYYKSHNAAITKQLDLAEPLLDAITDLQEKNSKSADLYYYRGLLSLHNGTIYNYRERARYYLTKADQLGHIYACLELGYLYGTTQSQEEKADACFQKVDASKHTLFSLKSRITESMVQFRTKDIHTSNDYLIEINKMKLAAGITYSYYHMERQAMDWLQEVSDNSLAQIMILYYKMKDVDQRTSHNIKLISDLMNPFEATPQLDYYSSMALSYGQFRLGQCYEDGDCVPQDDNKVLDYYTKACAYLQNNETYERLAEISGKSGADINLFPTLCNAARNDPIAIYKLAQYYHHKELNPADPDVPCKKAADQYLKAAQAGHTEACYYYAKYRIEQMRQSTQLNAAVKSKKAVNYLRMAANKNHGPSFYELGKLELAAGLYEEGKEDLKEADFLGCGAASFELGELYRKGFIGVISDKVTFRITQNLNTALQYYRRAMDLGHVLAMVRIGDFLETGALGEQSTNQAKAWYKRALSQGCPDGAAEYALGCLEETCISIARPADPQVLRKHRTTAFKWFSKALKANNKAAQFKIGCYLLHGWIPQASTPNDAERGVHILQDENANGNVMAMKELARYYQEKGDEKRAFSYWRNAELLNDPEALEFIAQCFEKGLLGQAVNGEAALAYRARALEARKQAVETQRSMMGFKSDYSDERNDRSK